MINTYFSLANEKYTLQERLLEVLNYIEFAALTAKVEVNIMLFSFTDEKIFERIVEILETSPNIIMHILADYSNVSNDTGKKIPALVAKKLSNLSIRFKSDFPYEWDETNLKFNWSYRASMGFLHHKTLFVRVENAPTLLVTGSYNWTKKSNKSYENLLVFDSASENISIMKSFTAEFDSIWNTPGLSISMDQVVEQTNIILKAQQQGIELSPQSVLTSKKVDRTAKQESSEKKALIENNFFAAFNAKNPFSEKATNGFAQVNQNRCFKLFKPNGVEKLVPINITNLLLDIIFRSPPQSELKIAIFALSNRVPEYGACFEAARKGVIIKIILDKKVSYKTAQLIKQKADLENLPIKVKLSNRMMHNKYLVNKELNRVLTGTANLTTDAVQRHSEHMILFTENASITKKFDDNFNLIWSRLKE